MTALVPFEELCSITGLERAGDVVRNLRKQGITVFIGKAGKPWTTIDLINQAGGRVVVTGSAEAYSPEICR
jgi:hypothetical protein